MRLRVRRVTCVAARSVLRARRARGGARERCSVRGSSGCCNTCAAATTWRCSSPSDWSHDRRAQRSSGDRRRRAADVAPRQRRAMRRGGARRPRTHFAATEHTSARARNRNVQEGGGGGSIGGPLTELSFCSPPPLAEFGATSSTPAARACSLLSVRRRAHGWQRTSGSRCRGGTS